MVANATMADSERYHPRSKSGDMAVGDRAGAERQARQLLHLTGARCLASTWIVCGHFVPHFPETVFSPARYRGNTAVNFFIVMSGFITHWVYGSRLKLGINQTMEFYFRRIGRVVMTTWIAMCFGLLVVCIQLRGFPDFGHVFRCFLFVEPWLEPDNWCPNGQTWTVAALLPSWLIYPITRRLVTQAEARAGFWGLMLLSVLLWGISFGPMVLKYRAQGNFLSVRQGVFFYAWPPSQMPDFAVGVIAAALAQRHNTVAVATGDANDDGNANVMREMLVPQQVQQSNHAWRAVFADLAVVIVFVAVLVCPSSGIRQGWEPLFDHCFMPLYAIFLYGSSAGGGSGWAARFLRHEALVALGQYSFEVYLFQWPMHESFVAFGDVTRLAYMRSTKGIDNNPEGFFVYFLVLWLVAGLYAENIERPMVDWLRDQYSEDPPDDYEKLFSREPPERVVTQPTALATHSLSVESESGLFISGDTPGDSEKGPPIANGQENT